MAEKRQVKPEWSAELWSAVSEGRLQGVRDCLDAGLSASVVNPHSGDTSYLHEAIEKGHDEVFRLLLERGGDVNLLSERGNPPLVTAVWRRKMEIIETLLARGADPNPHVYINGDTILHFAYAPRPYEDRTQDQFKVDREICVKLLRAGSDPNAPDCSGWTFIMHCPDDPEMLGLAFDHGARINLKFEGTPILFWFYHYPAGLQIAVERGGADIEARDEDQLTPLIRACHHGRLEAVRILLEKGASVSARAPALHGGKGTIDAFSIARENREKGGDHEEIFGLVAKRRPGLFARLVGK
jgi:ankyrin repeat protein